MLRKNVNTSFITKADFIYFKSIIIAQKYDFKNPISAKLNALKLKSESGDYSRDEIDRLKKELINAYQ